MYFLGSGTFHGVNCRWEAIRLVSNIKPFLISRGYGEYGQLGIGTLPASHPWPTAVNGLPPVVGVACGWRHTLAFTGRRHKLFINPVATGDLYAWGWNDCGQLGDGTLTDRPSPKHIPGIDVVATFCGGKHSMALTSMKY